MHQVLDINAIKLLNFFERQYGSGDYFEGIPYQRGYYRRQKGQGIGAALATVLRFLAPAAKTFGADLAKEGLATGARVLSNLSSGSDIKSAIKEPAIEGVKNLIAKTAKRYNGNRTSLAQKGTGKKRRKVIGRAYSLAEEPVKKPRADVFGPL